MENSEWYNVEEPYRGRPGGVAGMGNIELGIHYPMKEVGSRSNFKGYGFMNSGAGKKQ